MQAEWFDVDLGAVCWLNPRAVSMFGIIGEQDWAKD